VSGNVRALLLTCWAIGACALTNPDAGSPEALPHNGTGRFCLFDETQTMIAPRPPGRAIFLPSSAFERGSVAGGHLFYSAAPELDMPPMRDPTTPFGAIDWAQFEPRAIYRSPPRADVGFDDGALLLSASEAWEGTSVREPWALVRSSGQTLLFYVADGGIGLAQASDPSGAFTRVGTAPIVTDVDGAEPHNPSAIELGGEVLLYVQAGTGLALFRSQDGTTFTRDAELDLGEDVLVDDTTEVSVGGPGAVVYRSPIDRDIVRLYFESRRSDAHSTLLLAASTDGAHFERFSRPVMVELDLATPSPVVVDDRVSLLYLRARRDDDEIEYGTLVAAVTPGGTELCGD
jgi:hypothetical protein